jgi:hypothetical protein
MECFSILGMWFQRNILLQYSSIFFDELNKMTNPPSTLRIMTVGASTNLNQGLCNISWANLLENISFKHIRRGWN